MPERSSRRHPKRFPSAVPVAVLAAVLLLAGCASISGLEQARAMPPQVIAQQSDEFVCERLRGFGYIAEVPVAWLREAQRRKLESCIDQGIARRRSDDTNLGRFGCDRFAVVPIDRCR
ncbi:hypothetical protein [Thalassobaculum sp.]|uniref:hypothetical protein n=1 Tax=Thalassobaculum sp. TaxID=2022740 RepID=UPI0032EE25F5